MLYMVTLTISIPQMLAYIPYMDPMGMIQCEFQEPKMELLYHIRPYFGGIFWGDLPTMFHEASKKWRNHSNLHVLLHSTRIA